MDLGFYKSEKSKKNIELKEGKDDNGLYYYIDIEGLERRVGLPVVDHYIASREAKLERLKGEVSSAKLLTKDLVALAVPKGPRKNKKPKAKKKVKKK